MSVHEPRTVYVTVADSLPLDVGDLVVIGTGEYARVQTTEPDAYGRPFQKVTAVTIPGKAAA